MNLPPTWKGMGWTSKAGYLVDTHQAKDYSDACRILKDMRRPKPKPKPVARQAMEKRWDLNY